MPSFHEQTDLLIERMGNRPLQILIEIQRRYGHVPDDAIGQLAARLRLPISSIEGDVEFYALLSREPKGDYAFLMSDNITDWMQGSRALFSRLSENLGNNASLASTSCTGMCDQGPALLVNGLAVPNLNEVRIDAIADLVKRGIPVSSWPAEFFRIESNLKRRSWLFDDWQGPRLEGDELLQALQDCGLRGRGGAGFPTAKKWIACREAKGDARYVVCNADEGEPGTFKDRVLLQHRADRLFDGMARCAAIVGAKQGILYVRGEYRYLEAHLKETIAEWSGPDFEIELHWGAGAYICGEESALLESIEGKRGIPRIRPPFPVTHGLYGMPTVVDNVETFCAVSAIASGGDKAFRSLGTEKSKGTKLLSISGDCEAPGVYELPFGVSVEAILAECGAQDALAVQVGGAAGTCLDKTEFGREIGFEDLPTSGSIMIFNASRDMNEVAVNFTRFFADESCGFCTPCRVGTSLLADAVERMAQGREAVSEIENLNAVLRASHCGLGLSASRAVMDMLRKFPEHFGVMAKRADFFVEQR